MKIFLFLFLCLSTTWNLTAQRRILILDSLSHKPLVGVSVIYLNSNDIHYSDLEGYVLSLSDEDAVKISMLGYESISKKWKDLSDIVYLKPKSYLLKESIIYPNNPRDFIVKAFDSFQKNHVPFSFKQKVFYREEFIVNNDYLRFQEMDMEIFQFPKSRDSRKYYISGSYPKVNKLYRMDNHKKMEEVKNSLGKYIGGAINFNYLSLYSYTKGVNIMNFIFTTLLEDKEVQYKYIGLENMKGYTTIHIQGDHFEGSNLKYTSHIFLEENTYAVAHFSILASDYDISKKYIDFKTKVVLWLLGVRFKVKKYYTKIQFEPNQFGIWTVEDFMVMVPLELRKKIQLDGYMNICYRMDKNIEKVSIPMGSTIYQENQVLFDQYTTGVRFGDKLRYGIPLVPQQKERLTRMFQR